MSYLIVPCDELSKLGVGDVMRRAATLSPTFDSPAVIKYGGPKLNSIWSRDREKAKRFEDLAMACAAALVHDACVEAWDAPGRAVSPCQL